MVAWQPVGACMGVYDMAARYVQERVQFGAPIASFQLIQERLARMLGTVQVGKCEWYGMDRSVLWLVISGAGGKRPLECGAVCGC